LENKYENKFGVGKFIKRLKKIRRFKINKESQNILSIAK
jgi:hypothetical protein